MTPQEFQRRFGEAAAAFQQGRFDQCARAADALMKAAPDQPDVEHLYGLALFRTGKGATALPPLRKAAAKGNPGHIRSLAIVLRELGQRSEAISVIKMAGGGAGPLAGLLGILYLEEGELPNAAAALRSATSLNPEDVEAQINLGIVEQQRGRNAQAEAAFQKALAKRPNHSGARIRLAQLMQARGALYDAETLLRASPNAAFSGEEVMALAHLLRAAGVFDAARAEAARAAGMLPENLDAALLQSAIAMDAGDFDDARAHLDHAAQLAPETNAVDINRALVDHMAGEWQAARDRLAKLGDDNPALYHLAQVERDLGNFGAAREAIQKVLAADPENADAKFERAHLTLMEGALASGFKDYESRWDLKARKEGRLPPRPTLGLPRWNGQDKGRLVLLAEQGFGDTIMFARFAELAQARADNVTLFCSEQLSPLLEPSLDGVAVVTASLTPEAAKGFDFELPIMSLPHALGLTDAEITAKRTWLKVPDAARSKWADRLAGLKGYKIALVWSGNPEFAQQGRWLTFDKLAPLFEVQGIDWASLQLGPARSEIANAPERFHDWTDHIKDFADTAAIVEGMDLVLSCDSVLSHVAGGLGKPFWMMNRFQSEWRWQRNRTDSPWYPTARLFNQPHPGDWDAVTRGVAEALKDLI